MPPARQIAEKELIGCPTFQFRADLDKLVSSRQDVPFGVYFNQEESFESGVFFAPLGLYLPPNGQHYVSYKEIAEVTLPDKYVMKEPTTRQLGLILTDGRTVILPVHGERERMLDIYDVNKFLYKVRIFAKKW